MAATALFPHRCKGVDCNLPSIRSLKEKYLLFIWIICAIYAVAMAVICTYLTSRAEKEGTNKAHQAIDLFNAMNRELLRKYAAQPEYQDYKLSVWYDGGKDMKKFADAFKDNALTEDIEEELQGIVASVFLKPKDGIIEIDLISKSALEN